MGILVEGKDFMKLIFAALLMGAICYLFLLLLKQQNDLKERVEQLESENIEQNKRLIRLETKEIEKVRNEERDNFRENKRSSKPIRRNR